MWNLNEHSTKNMEHKIVQNQVRQVCIKPIDAQETSSHILLKNLIAWKNGMFDKTKKMTGSKSSIHKSPSNSKLDS